MIPGTEYIADREAANFCDEFELLGLGPTKKQEVSERTKKLFGDDTPPKKGFQDLFKD